MTAYAFTVGDRVRSQRLFLHWRQTPGTVVETDFEFGRLRVQFDNGVTKWVAAVIMEPAPTKATA